MSVVSYIFLLFLFVVVCIYYLVPKKVQWMVLLAASIAFYAYSGVGYLLIVLCTALVVYVLSLQIQKNLERQAEMLEGTDRKEGRKIKNEMRDKRKRILVAALVVVIGVLVVFKGSNFIVDNINVVLQKLQLGQINSLELIAPLGISFYSFMMISYLADLYYGKITAQKNFLKYLTYALYFPHVTQGPIARYDEVAPQLFKHHRFDYDAVLKGSWLMLWGYFKKLVIADRLAMFVTEVIGKSDTYTGPIFLFTGLVYSIQIYCDFSGCMDIIRGASECFGVVLTENFKRPYFSQTLPEFWRRWHISLGAFFREYVFYPVSTSTFFLNMNTKARNRFGNVWGRNLASCIPILCVWILTGVWHGANWNYICWGLYHGILICFSTMFEQPLQTLTEKLHIKTDCFPWKVFRIVRTFFLCLIGRIIFLGNGLGDSLHMIGSSFTDMDVFYPVYKIQLGMKAWIVVFVSCMLLFMVSVMQEIREQKGVKETIRDWLAQRNLVVRWIVLIGGIMAVLVFGVYGSGVGATFIYEQF